MLHRLLASSLALAPLLAQTAPPPPKPAPAALTAKSFLVDDVKNFTFVDFALLRKTGVWDDLAVSALKVAFQQIEKQMGCPFTALDRITALAKIGDGEGMVASEQITVFEGNRDLGLPDSVERGQQWSRDEGKDGVEVWRSSVGRSQMLVRPGPTVRVEGSEAMIAPVLDGKPWSNRQTPDAMSLLSGGKQDAMHMVVDVGHPLLRANVLGRLMPDQEWPEGDEPTFACLRIVVTGEAEDPHLGVEAVLRHQQGEDGVKASQQAATALVERLAAMPAMRAVKATLQKTQTRIDRTDLVLTLDLGRSRDAVGTLATLALPLFVRSAPEPAAQVEPPPPPGTQPKK